MTILKALTAGIRTTNRSYRMIALLYAVNVFIALILAWGFHAVLVNTIGDSLSLEHLVKDFDYTVYTDFMFKHGERITALLSQLTWLIVFYFLLNTLLGGGTIAALKNIEEQFSMRSFFSNCGAYFFRFLRLLLIFGVIIALVVFTTSIIFGGIHSALTDNSVSEVWPITLGIIFLLFFLFIGMLVVMMADYAKVATVATDAKSMLKTSWQGIKFVFRHFFSTVGLQLIILLFLLVAVVVYLLLENQIGMATPFTILLMFILQQVSVGFKVWTRVLTFAGDLELYKGFEAEFPAPVSTLPATVPEPVRKTLEPAASVAPEKAEKKKRAKRRISTRKAPAAHRRTSKKSR